MKKGNYNTTIWALSDQAIVSGGNFLTNFILIRTIQPTSYGTYALLLTTVLFLNNLQASMVTYPVCLLGARSEDHESRGIAMGGLVATSLGSVVNAIVITIACLSLHRPALIGIVLAATVFWQLQETLRTVFTSRQAFNRSLLGDALSYLGQACVLGIVCWYRIPSLPIVFFVMLLTSFLAALCQGIQIRPQWMGPVTLRLFLDDLWKLGKWSTLGKLLGFFTAQALPWLLAYASGLAAVASFQALLQLVALANPLLLGFNTIISASVASQKRVSGGTTWSASVRQIRLAAILLSSYYLMLALFGHLLMKLFFGLHSPYLVHVPLLRYCALAAVLEACAMLAGAVLGGLGATRFIFIVQLYATTLSVLIVFPLILHFGLTAAVFGLIGIAGTRAGVGCYLAQVELRKESQGKSQAGLA